MAEQARRRARLVPLREVDQRLREAWTDLACRAVEPNPYLEPGPVLAAARHLPDGAAAELLVVERAGRLELALPVLRARGYRRVPVPTYRAWGHDDCFLETPLLDSPDPEATWGSALAGLASGTTGWLSFEQLPGDGAVRLALEAAGRRGAAPVVLGSTERPVVHRRAEATYLDGRLSSSRRRKLGRTRRRLERELDAEVSLVDRSAVDPQAALARFLELEAGGWKGEAGTALATSSARAAAFTETFADACAAGRAQLWELRAGETVVAALCVLVGGSGAFHVKTAFDEAFSSSSPGLQLEVAVLEAFHDDPALEWIDSGSVEDASSPSTLLYPDRRRLDAVVVPLRGRASRLPALTLRGSMLWRARRSRGAEPGED
ncbi:GNAT family N-acetyltransferase [uncultured Nocardioides sp.]|uniref:GNAT family N-acetyltransferase n=1 Tax=uncultured Nocardioides sp. TaxID=198441 RepID=UPI0030FC1CBC